MDFIRADRFSPPFARPSGYPRNGKRQRHDSEGVKQRRGSATQLSLVIWTRRVIEAKTTSSLTRRGVNCGSRRDMRHVSDSSGASVLI